MIPELFSLQGRTAVITGAGLGLGRAFAMALAAAGARVACLDRDTVALAETIASLDSNLAIGLEVDVASEFEVDRTFADVLRWNDGIDVLINNAGIATPPCRTHEVSVADWDRAITTNLRSVFLCTRAAIPALMKSRGGSIINVSSILALKGMYPGFSITAIPYAASKAGIIGFTRQLAIEYAKDGIRANVIAPGWHGGTRLGREYREKATLERIAATEEFIAKSVPMGRRGAPMELDGLVLYLASDASKYVTGQLFGHDGGVSAA